MKNRLLSEFRIDKAAHTVFVNREFAVELSLVWDAFTKQEILDKWWAPKPWKSRTEFMDFKVGVRRFYAMVGPEGQEHWSIQDYTAISPMNNFKYTDAFTDKNQHINLEMPGSEWNLTFSTYEGITSVSMVVKHKSLADLKKILEMGFQEGFTMTLNYLEELLNTLV